MAETRYRIIKKNNVGAADSVDSGDAFPGRAPRIPCERVAAMPGDRPAPVHVGPRISRDLTRLSNRPVEVGPVPIERPKPRALSAEMVEPHQPTIGEIEEAWKARMDQARSEAREDGIALGRAEAKAVFDEQQAELRAAFAADLENIQQSWESFLRRAEPWILQLSFRVAAAVLDAPIPDNVRRVNERVVATAVEGMADGIPLEVVLHPVSFLRIKESGIYGQLISNNSKLRWRTNTEVKQNEWIVQSQRAVTRRLESELIERLRHELSLLEIHRPDDSIHVPNERKSTDAETDGLQDDGDSLPDNGTPSIE